MGGGDFTSRDDAAGSLGRRPCSTCDCKLKDLLVPMCFLSNFAQVQAYA